MKGLYRYLSPAASDASGAVSVLFELGGMIVITDAGGCTGNICGFDEPRWFTHRSAVYSAGLRDIDAILGRDDRLIEKIRAAAAEIDPYFIAMIGTPVPSVIATDYAALARLLERRLEIPALYIETTGMESYDVGQRKAYEAVLKLLKRARREQAAKSGAAGAMLSRVEADHAGEPIPDLGIWGATPLDLPGTGSVHEIVHRGKEFGYEHPVCYGMDSGLWELAHAKEVKANIVASWSGLTAARALEKKGIPYILGTGAALECGIREEPLRSFAEEIEKRMCEDRNTRILIIHQQLAAEALRRRILTTGSGMVSGDALLQITVGSFFRMDPEFFREGDLHFDGEDELIRAADGETFDIIAGDPLYRRALRHYTGVWMDLPHFAVSGQMYMDAYRKGRISNGSKV